jgi:hypothetical protein
MLTTMVMITMLAIMTTTIPIQYAYASTDLPGDKINEKALKACESTDKPRFCPSDGGGDGDMDPEEPPDIVDDTSPSYQEEGASPFFVLLSIESYYKIMFV